jgi:hypothetical protein
MPRKRLVQKKAKRISQQKSELPKEDDLQKAEIKPVNRPKLLPSVATKKVLRELAESQAGPKTYTQLVLEKERRNNPLFVQPANRDEARKRALALRPPSREAALCAE